MNADSNELAIRLETEGSVYVVNVNGSFDAITAPAIRDVYEQMPAEGNVKVVLDLDGVDFMDSSGVGALMFLLKRLRARNGELVVGGVSGQPAQLVKMLHLEKAVGVHADRAQAIASIT